MQQARADLVAGRRDRHDWLVAERRFVEALELVRTMGQSQMEEEREMGVRLGRQDGTLASALWRDLEASVARREFEAAERSFALLRQLQPMSNAASAEPEAKSIDLAPDDLPLALDGDRILWRLDGAMVVLRIPGEGGGYRYERRSLHEIDPMELRSAVLRARSEPSRLLAVLAAHLCGIGRPLSALLLREGRVR